MLRPLYAVCFFGLLFALVASAPVELHQDSNIDANNDTIQGLIMLDSPNQEIVHKLLSIPITTVSPEAVIESTATTLSPTTAVVTTEASTTTHKAIIKEPTAIKTPIAETQVLPLDHSPTEVIQEMTTTTTEEPVAVETAVAEPVTQIVPLEVPSEYQVINPHPLAIEETFTTPAISYDHVVVPSPPVFKSQERLFLDAQADNLRALEVAQMQLQEGSLEMMEDVQNNVIKAHEQANQRNLQAMQAIQDNAAVAQKKAADAYRELELRQLKAQARKWNV